MSLSTLRTLTLTESVGKEEEEVAQLQIPDTLGTEKSPSISSHHKTPSELSKVTSNASPTSQTCDVPVHSSTSIASQAIPSTPSSSLGLLSNSKFVDNYALLQGQELSESVKSNHESPFYNAGSLEVQIEYSTTPNQIASESHPGNLSYSIEWLTVDEAERVLEKEPSLIFDAESLEVEVSHNVDGLKCFYITARGSILKILLKPSIAGSSLIL